MKGHIWGEDVGRRELAVNGACAHKRGGEISVGGFLLLLGLNEKCLLNTNVFYLIYSCSICCNSKNQNFGAAGQLPVTAGRNHLLNDLINHFIPVFAHSDCTP